MKKKLLSALLCLALALTLLPTAALAAPTRLKSVDLVIDLPKAGDPNEMETEVTIKSMKSGNIDLLANGAGILYTEWQGDDVETDDGFSFRAGTTYLVNIKLAFDTTKGYCANYKTVGGENIVGPDTFSATVNGVPATIRTSAQYYPTLQVSLTLEGERYTEQEKEELNADLTRKTELLQQAKRAMVTPRTQAVAESKQLENFVNGVTVMTDPSHVLENTDSIRTLILDTNEKITDGTCFFICYAKYLKELWLSDKVDVYQFIQAMDSYLWLPIAGLYRWERQSDLPFYTAETVVYIPESAVPALKAAQAQRGYKIPYTIKTYSGNDVYAAQKAGDAAAKGNWCTAHQYTLQIRTADRVYTYAQACQYARRYYYSCSICGKCEHNAGHVAPHNSDKEIELKTEKLAHSDNGEYPTAEAYIGVNAAGEHVYWLSCEYCGHSYRYLQQHLTSRDVYASGTGMTLAQYQAEANASLQWEETQALNTTELYPGTFTLSKKSAAKTSSWAESDVNLALNDDLLDTALLGSDYTKPISRLQFCSVAVRLAETLTWAKEAMAFMNALDLVKGTTATTLNPNGTCTIEQAVIVAERSVYAHQIGWYQAAPVTNVYSYNDSTGEIEREDGEYTSFDSTNASLHPGDLVWITGKLTGVSNLLATAPGTTVDQCVYSAYLPGINPYTGQIMYLHYRDLIPVRG